MKDIKTFINESIIILNEQFNINNHKKVKNKFIKKFGNELWEPFVNIIMKNMSHYKKWNKEKTDSSLYDYLQDNNMLEVISKKINVNEDELNNFLYDNDEEITLMFTEFNEYHKTI